MHCHGWTFLSHGRDDAGRVGLLIHKHLRLWINTNRNHVHRHGLIGSVTAFSVGLIVSLFTG